MAGESQGWVGFGKCLGDPMASHRSLEYHVTGPVHTLNFMLYLVLYILLIPL